MKVNLEENVPTNQNINVEPLNIVQNNQIQRSLAFPRDKCQVTFDDESKLSKHLKIHTSELCSSSIDATDKGSIMISSNDDTVDSNNKNPEINVAMENVNSVEEQENSRANIVNESSASTRCPFCENSFESLNSLKEHIEQVHIEKSVYSKDVSAHDNLTSSEVNQPEICCNNCSQVFVSDSDLRDHLLEFHSPSQCSICNLALASKALLNQHINSCHSQSVANCKYCEYVGNSEEDLTNHMYTDHEEIVVMFNMGRQIEKLSTSMEDFCTFKSELSNTLQKIKDTQNELKQELFLIRNKQELQFNSLPPSPSQHNQKLTVPMPSSSHLSQEHIIEPVPSNNGQEDQMNRNSKTQPNAEPRILYICDEVGANVDIKHLEHATRKKVIRTKAYTTINSTEKNAAKKPPLHPKFNFTDVIAEKISHNDYHSLIIQSGSVDITNLDTKSDPATHTEYYRQEVKIAAQNLFTAASNAIIAQPSLEKIVILKQLPRYDPISVDPMSIKPALASLFNITLTEEWMASNFKDKITIADHDIDCTGAVRLARFKESKTGRYDGVHLLGSSGKKTLTNRLLTVLENLGFVENNQKYEPWSYTTRTGRQSEMRNIETSTTTTHNRFSPLSTMGNW